MKLSTFNKRTSGVNKSSKGYVYAKEILINDVVLHTCHTSGSGRYIKNMDYTQDTVDVLKLAGLRQDLDFTVGNDAPRGGKCGNFIKLTGRGRRKMIQRMIKIID